MNGVLGGQTLDAAAVAAFRGALLDGVRPGDRSACVDLLRALEDVKSAVCAAQARVSVQLDEWERESQAAAGVPAERLGAGVGLQVALARRESPHRGSVLLGVARALCDELPCAWAALAEGRLSEYRALLIVRETACLSREDRAEVDRLVCGDPAVLAGLGTRRLSALLRGHAARLDPAAVARRAARAEGERRVTVRPAPETMTYLTALLPVAQGVAAYAALVAHAQAAVAAGDPRGRGQVMADALVERLTGQACALDVPVAVNLVLSDATLLASGAEPAHLIDGGPVPAAVARTLVANGLDAGAAWVRRLYSDPDGALVAMTSAARFCPDGLADFLRVRDQGICRTPWCDAPIRHLDHVVPAADGGATAASNAQGLCEACNHAKQAPGWDQQPAPGDGRHTVTTIAPTGHRYDSTAPPPPVPLARATTTSVLERVVADDLWAA